MAGNLKIDYEKARTVGNNIMNYAGDFKSLLQGINSINENLKQHWQGDDATKYTSEMSEQAKVMDKLHKTIEDVGKYLVDVGNAYEQAMHDNTIK